MRPANGLLKMELTMKDYAKGFHDMIESLRADHEISVVSSYIFQGQVTQTSSMPWKF